MLFELAELDRAGGQSRAGGSLPGIAEAPGKNKLQHPGSDVDHALGAFDEFPVVLGLQIPINGGINDCSQFVNCWVEDRDEADNEADAKPEDPTSNRVSRWATFGSQRFCYFLAAHQTFDQGLDFDSL